MITELTISQQENNFRRGLFSMILIEFLLFVFSGVSFQGLEHVAYVNFGIDPVYWLFFLLQIPQFIFRYHEIGLILDIIILLLLIYSVFIKENKFVTWSLFILLMLYYVSLTATLGHRNYQTGFFIMIIPFLFSNQISRKFAFEGIRYFYVFFYFSSGLFKIFNNGIFEPLLLPSTLKQQFIPYYLEFNTGLRTFMNSLLIRHERIAFLLYFISFIVETTFVVGFFTKKWDYVLGLLLICFHFSNWVIMDIAAIGQLAVIFFFLRYKESN